MAANALTQTAEYFAVTRGLVEQVTHLTHLVQQLLANQQATATLLGRGTLSVLTKLGATKEEALAAVNTPFATSALPAERHALVAPVPPTPLPQPSAAAPAPVRGADLHLDPLPRLPPPLPELTL